MYHPTKAPPVIFPKDDIYRTEPEGQILANNLSLGHLASLQFSYSLGKFKRSK